MQEINNETVPLNNPLDQMDLTDVYRTLHPKPEDTFQVHGEHFPGEIALGHNSRLNKLKTEAISSTFPTTMI